MAAVDPLALSGRWGIPDHPVDLGSRAANFLRSQVGAAQPWPRVEPADWPVREAVLSDDEIRALQTCVGPEAVRTDRRSRIIATGGASYADYAARHDGVQLDAPDAVVLPATHDEALAVLAACRGLRLPVVPLGGGTSVVGGLAAVGRRIAVSTERMCHLLHLDDVSCLVTVGAGITGPRLEPLLAARGLTLGHFPQSWQRASVGGYAATRSAGQASTGYGRSDDMVEALRVATPEGTLELGRGPASAAGPDLLGLLVGSEGAYGLITEVTLRVRRLPGAVRYEGVMLPDFAAGLDAFRAMAQSRASADVMRLSDEAETAVTLALSGPSGPVAAALERYLSLRGVPPGTGCLAILGWEGVDRDQVKDRRAASWRALRRHGAIGLGRRVGESWRSGRFHGPLLRDALMDLGYVVETVESAAHWSGVPRLHAAVAESLRSSLGPPPGPYVMAHVSHVYETGASVYTTVLAVADRSDPVAQWRAAKREVSEAIVGCGSTITHHHAVGRDHRPWIVDEVGPLGVDVLAAVKKRLDPDGILNPGVLLDDPPTSG